MCQTRWWQTSLSRNPSGCSVVTTFQEQLVPSAGKHYPSLLTLWHLPQKNQLIVHLSQPRHPSSSTTSLGSSILLSKTVPKHTGLRPTACKLSMGPSLKTVSMEAHSRNGSGTAPGITTLTTRSTDALVWSRNLEWFCLEADVRIAVTRGVQAPGQL